MIQEILIAEYNMLTELFGMNEAGIVLLIILIGSVFVICCMLLLFILVQTTESKLTDKSVN